MDELIFNGVKLKLARQKITSSEDTSLLPNYLFSIEEYFYNIENNLGGFMILKLNVDEPKFIMSLLKDQRLIDIYVEIYQDYHVEARCGLRIFINNVLKTEIINYEYWEELNRGLC